MLNLEADEVTPGLRRWIAERVAELEDAVTEPRQRLAALADQSATEPPVLADVALLLDGLPLLANGLVKLDQSELRTLFKIIQLEATCQPGDNAIDVAVTLSDHWQSSDLRELA